MAPPARRSAARRPVRPTFDSVIHALPAAIALTLLSAVPSFMNLASQQIFEEQKSLLVLAAAMVALPGAILAWNQDGTRIHRDLIVVSFLAFVVVIAISAVAAGAPRDAILGAHNRRHGLVMWISLAVMLLVMCASARSRVGRERIVIALVAGSVWPALYLLVQRGGGDPVPWIVPAAGFQLGSTFGNRVLLGGYLAMVLPLTMMQAWRSHWTWAVLVVLQAVALVGSGSRGALLAMAAGVLVFASVIGLRRISRRVALGGLLAVAIAAAALVAVPGLGSSWTAQRLNPTEGSARVRVLIWRNVVSLLRASGWHLAIGRGPESLRRVILPHYSSEIARIEASDAMPDRSHNEVLDTLVTSGVSGVVLLAVFFVITILAAVQIKEEALGAGLVAALVAHIVETQFGIAAVGSRLACLAIAAIVVGMRAEPTAARSTAAQPTNWLALVVGGLAGALSPVVSILPHYAVTSGSTGTTDDLVKYLDQLALGTPILYASLLLAALWLAWVTAEPERARRPAVLRVGVAVGLLAAFPLCLWPTHADHFSAAGDSFESSQRWTEAAVAYREASRRAPAVAFYPSNLGRTLIYQAVTTSSAPRDQLLAEAEAAYRSALALEPFDPDHHRHLASLLRVRASTMDEPARGVPLEEADRVYAGITERVPTLTSLWIEWAYVDLDRHRPAQALERLGKAIALDDRRAEAFRLRGDVRLVQHETEAAIVDYDAAIARAPRDPLALRGRATALAELQRRDEALVAVDAALGVAPDDTDLQTLKSHLSR